MVRHAAPTSGRLGQTDFELGPERIVVRRSWRLVVLVPLIPLAIAIVAWTLSQIEPGPQDPVVPIVSTLVAAAMLVGGIIGAVSVPWFRPRMFTCTPDSVLIDDRRLPASEIAQIQTEVIVRRGKGVTEYGLCLVIVSAMGERTRMEVVASRQSSSSTVELIALAMKQMLSAAVGGGAAHLPDPR